VRLLFADFVTKASEADWQLDLTIVPFLHAAYNDMSGVTAAFNKNVLVR
jgi:hypothetical protein